MMVVWHHALGQVRLAPQFAKIPQIGGYGVDLFFIISGFIMLVTTWDKPIGPAEFIKHRIRRVVPLYWLATLLMVGAAVVAPALFKTLKWDAEALVKSLLFVPYYSLSFPGNVEPLLVPGWSLNYEMFFYALFAGLLLVGRNWRVPVMVGVLSLLTAAGLIWRPTAAALVVYLNPVLLEFGAGMILGRLWVMRKHPRRDGGNAVLLALGDASYSIYLTHLFTLGALRVLWVRLVPDVTLESSVAFVALCMTSSAIVGWACYLLVERRMTARGLVSGRKVTASA